MDSMKLRPPDDGRPRVGASAIDRAHERPAPAGDDAVQHAAAIWTQHGSDAAQVCFHEIDQAFQAVFHTIDRHGPAIGHASSNADHRPRGSGRLPGPVSTTGTAARLSTTSEGLWLAAALCDVANLPPALEDPPGWIGTGHVGRSPGIAVLESAGVIEDGTVDPMSHHGSPLWADLTLRST